MDGWLAGTNDPDSMASVLYFQRLAAGTPLEVTVLTTPKPLLTVLYGVSWNLLHDWRSIVWETIAVHGLTIALAAAIAGRLAGVPAATFTAAALIFSAPQLAEVAQANSLPWALLGWLAAGLALTSTPPRFALAGVALLLAGLVRIETWILLAVATAAIGLLAVPAVRARAPDSPNARTMLPLLIGWLAAPIQLLHDLALTGNPFYWLSIPQVYTSLVTPDLQPQHPIHFLGGLVTRYGAEPGVLLLASIGIVYLVRARRWAILLGVAAIVGGVVALLGWLALRGTYISVRYYEAPMLGILFAAGIGVGALTIWLSERIPSAPGSVLAMGGAVAGAGLAVLLQMPGPLTPELAERFEAQHAASANLDAVRPDLRAILDAAPESPPSAVKHEGYSVVDPRLATMYVPRPLALRVAVELDVPLTRLADGTVASVGGPPEEILLPGQYVYHDANIDGPEEWFSAFEVTEPEPLGDLNLVPITVQPGQFWLLSIQP